MKRAIIFGANGQDGSYLSELLLEKSYLVTGIVRRCSVDNCQRIHHLVENPNYKIVEGDLTDGKSVFDIIAEVDPDEVYNLAAQSHVATSFKQPDVTWNTNAVGVFHILDAVKKHCGRARVYQASTSEMYGSNVSATVTGPSIEEYTKDPHTSFYHRKFQDEDTPFMPNSPYAIAKLAAHHAVRMYRDAYDIFACSGILFNHESPRRGEKFVTRKITQYVAKLNSMMGYEVGQHNLHARPPVGYPPLRLGNLDAKRDWGHAKDYVKGMWLMLQQDKPDDYVLATGKTHTIRELLQVAFEQIGIKDWGSHVVVDPEFYRPLEVSYLLGNASKAEKILGWTHEYDFKKLIREMVNEDIKAV
jgi:GDPmannose 4,6-dehydratase